MRPEGELARAIGAAFHEVSRAPGLGLDAVPPDVARALVAEALVDAAFHRACEARGLPPFELPSAVAAPAPDRARLAAVATRALGARSFDEEGIGRLYEILLEPPVSRSDRALGQRRRSGKHYTPRALADEVTAETLAPLLARAASSSELAALRIADPAMGSGAFVLAALRALSAELVRRGEPELAARRIALRALRGVDADPGAVRVTKELVYLHVRDASLDLGELHRAFVVGDALAGPAGARTSSSLDALRAFFRARGAEAPAAIDWAQRFPDVVGPDGAGFDALVGNPPFTGGKRIATTLGPAYAAWLRVLHEGANGNVDLAAHFLRRAFDLLRVGGRLGFITTNTIAQGDTRVGGLAYVCGRGGVITSARPRVEWPGDAAVVVSVVCVERAAPGAPRSPASIDGAPVRSIDAFLREGDVHDDPARLPSRRGLAFIGCFLRGMGFTFDDASPSASPLAEMRAILAEHPASSAVIRPYLGGEEVNASPTHAHRRYAIDLYPLAEDEARRRHPTLVALLERKVRPFRASLGESAADRAHKARWWRFANDREELRTRVAALARVFVIPRVSAHLSVVSLPADVLCSEQLVVVALEGWDAFAILQSRVHEVWARRHSSTLGDGLRYTPSDSFETFPFPARSEGLAELGRAYHAHRARMMTSTGRGLTASWRRFHDPADSAPDVVELRRRHDAIDRAVLAAYGWDDLAIAPAFRASASRSPRYALADETTRELLRRLASENAKRARDDAPSR